MTARKSTDPGPEIPPSKRDIDIRVAADQALQRIGVREARRDRAQGIRLQAFTHASNITGLGWSQPEKREERFAETTDLAERIEAFVRAAPPL